MQTKVTTNIRIEPELKEEAKKVLESLGLDMSTAITLYLKQVVRLKAIPFDISISDIKDNEEELIKKRNERMAAYAELLSANKLKIAKEQKERIEKYAEHLGR